MKTKYRTPKQIVPGVKWMDENKPNWWREIKITEFDMEDSRCCILGQAFEDFWNVAPAFGKVTRKGMPSYMTLLKCFGLNAGEKEMSRQAEMWLEVIRHRRKKGKA